jgi:hypothetical protein
VRVCGCTCVCVCVCVRVRGVGCRVPLSSFNARDSQNPNEPQPEFCFFSLFLRPQKQWIQWKEQHASDVSN